MSVNTSSLRIVMSVAALSAMSPALAMEGVFDRTAEVDQYLEALNSVNKIDVTAAVNRIYWSGVSDKRLGDVLNERLLRDFSKVTGATYPPVAGPRFHWTMEERYGVGLIQALASLGIPEYNSTFAQIGQEPKKGGAADKLVRKEALQAPKIVSLRAGLNQLMASRENHVEGGDPTTSMLINLLKSDNHLYRDFALDKIQKEKLRDPRLLEFLASQIMDYVNRAPVSDLTWKEKYVRRNIQLLGRSGNAKYRQTMEDVLASKVDSATKKEAKEALEPLRGPAP